MKRIIFCIKFLFILNLIFAFSSCSHAGNSRNDDEEDALTVNFDPFAGTTWYGDLYEGVLKWTSDGYVSYGDGDDQTTWYFKDTLPRTIYKQTE